MKVSHSAALAAIALAAHSALATSFSVLLSSGDSVGDQTYYSTDQLVLDNAGNVATLSKSDNFESLVTLSTLSGGTYSHSLILTGSATIPSSSDLYESFENLSLTTIGGTPTLYFVAPANGDDRAGIFRSIGGATPTTVFYGNSPNDPSLTTISIPTVNYSLSAGGQVSYGTHSVVSGEMVQTLHLTDPTTGLNTTGLQNFNVEMPEPEYAVRTVALDSSIVAVAQSTSSSAYGVYDLTGAAAPVTRYTTLTDGLHTYAPRQLIGATANQSVVVGQSADDQNLGGVFYQDHGAITPLITGINPGNSTQPGFSNSQLISGEMTAGGKAAVYVPDTGILYHDTTSSNTQVLAAGDLVRDGNNGNHSISGFDFSVAGGTQPMVNDNGWVVAGVTLDDASQALVAWKPGAQADIIAKVGDIFTLPGKEGLYEILFFPNQTSNANSDVLKDGLNELNQVAFNVAYLGIDEANSGDFGYALLTADLSATPEPASLAVLGLAGGLLLRRRRRTPH